MEKQNLIDSGFKGVNLSNIKWIGFNEENDKLVLLNKKGVARVYEFTEIV